MITFKYSVLDKNNNIVNGNTKAISADEVRDMLIAEGYKIIKIKADAFSAGLSIYSRSKKVSGEEIALFCKQMSIITKSGISVIKGLSMIRSQSDSKKIQGLCENIYTNIQKGYSIFDAFKNCGYRLPLLLINMIKIGELTGNMDQIFKKMTEYFEKENRTKKKIKGAMIYPIILITMSVIVISLFLLKLLPQMSSVVQEAGGTLPEFTQLLLNASAFLNKNYQYGGIVLFAFIVIFKWGTPLSFKVKIKDLFIFKMPVLNVVTRDFVTARFVRTMGILVKTGLPLLTVLETLEHAIGIDSIGKKIREVQDGINKGESLTSSLEHMGYFDGMVTNIISIGEETGTLDDSLLDMADYYDEKFDNGVSKLISLIEPIFTLGMGVIIGGIVISVMLPMFSMMSSMSGD